MHKLILTYRKIYLFFLFFSPIHRRRTLIHVQCNEAAKIQDNIAMDECKCEFTIGISV